ncbi:hypothetical protein PSE_p0274 (plasmid) [Pseudovibrio sp. FO-BEG1]|uniref:hypothetical protein n=1 Tax=Pseudovibrio sp. (strain FO-BEG1) TaxID=911045 RepID=UPI000238D0B0|nr:hypothetical protein [Pseudovibrio sp. FO-BEG1]AEV39856.1 hypothetical protein PSE_p0274 [Pseudovibrio sp. FO-BEG1]
MLQRHNKCFKHCWLYPMIGAVALGSAGSSAEATTLREALEDTLRFNQTLNLTSWKTASKQQKSEVLSGAVAAYAALYLATQHSHVYLSSLRDLDEITAVLERHSESKTTQILEHIEALEAQRSSISDTLMELQQNALLFAQTTFTQYTGSRSFNLQSVITSSLLNGSGSPTDVREESEALSKAIKTYRQLQFGVTRQRRNYEAALAQTKVGPEHVPAYLTVLTELQKTELQLISAEAELTRLHFADKAQRSTLLLHLGLSERLLEKNRKRELRRLANQRIN